MNRNLLNQIETRLSIQKGGIDLNYVKQVFDNLPKDRYISKLKIDYRCGSGDWCIWDKHAYKFIKLKDSYVPVDTNCLVALNDDYRLHNEILFNYLVPERWDKGLYN